VADMHSDINIRDRVRARPPFAAKRAALTCIVLEWPYPAALGLSLGAFGICDIFTPRSADVTRWHPAIVQGQPQL
jgi:hypothetical protein